MGSRLFHIMISFAIMLVAASCAPEPTPPPVDPTQPPMKEKNSSITGRKDGQAAKFWVAKPVVVVIEMAWKIPCTRLSPGRRVSVMIRYAQVMAIHTSSTLKKKRVSESLRYTLGERRRQARKCRPKLTADMHMNRLHTNSTFSFSK